MNEPNSDTISFEDLGLSHELLSAIKECGYTKPTPIQEKAIPIILMSRDMIGKAQTGSGKTASFTLPMIDILHGRRARIKMPRSLILAPTRELAAQVAENFDTYGKNHSLSSALLVGGESIREQKKILGKGVDVLVATPGRLLDLFEQGELLMSDINILVIDEADRMLDMGFIPDIEKIISLLPVNRQTLLFSATMPDEIKRLADKFLSNPKTVNVAPAKGSAKSIQEHIIWTTKRDKRKALMEVLDTEDIKNAFIFCNRKKDVDELSKFLKNKGLSAQAMHGDMPQKIRTETLSDFKEDKIIFLVCSDVAARGLDVEAVSHVFNYDVPFNAEDYVHRIGRTGRAGQKGVAYTIAVEDDLKYVEAIEKEVKKKLEELDLKKAASFSRDNLEAGDDKDQKQGYKKDGRNQSKGQNNKSKPSARRHQKDDRNSSSSSKSRSHKNRTNDNRTEDKVVGFGDDIPAFLKRS